MSQEQFAYLIKKMSSSQETYFQNVLETILFS